MSQNPYGPNYNPYGSNPNQSNPNYPGTAYGSGSNPNYPPPPVYPPANPPSGPNPNTPNAGYGVAGNPNTPNSGYGSVSNPGTPNSSYGPYGNPYAPPPPLPGSYADAPANPYDPYAQTSMSQHPISSPGYPVYSSAPAAGQLLDQPPPPVLPPSTQPKKNRVALIVTLVVVVLLIAGGSVGFLSYTSHQNTLHGYATATTVSTNSTATAAVVSTAQTIATSTAIASLYPFSNKQVLNDPMVDNSKGVHWDNSQSTGCYFAGSAYHVVEGNSNYYNTCAALGTDYTNFTFETEMVIRTGGDAPAGGLIFRADENGNKYYRLSIDTSGNYFVLAIVDSTGTGAHGNARKLTEGTASSFSTGLGSTNTLAIVANGDQFTFYVNQMKVTSFTDGTYTHGQIGFDVDYGTSKTELVFTNTRVWQLPS